MNIVCSSMHSKLSAVNLAALMFVSMNGPPLRNWNALPYVKSWLARDRRDATYLACPKRHQQSENSGPCTSITVDVTVGLVVCAHVVDV